MTGARRARSLIGILFDFAISKKDRSLAKRKQAGSQVRSGNSKSVNMVTQGPVVKLGKFADASLDAGTDGGGPEDALLAELQVVVAAFSQKLRDFLVRSASKEEDFVKVTLADELGLPLWQACVLSQFSR